MRNGWTHEQLLAALSEAMKARQAVPSWFVESGKNAQHRRRARAAHLRRPLGTEREMRSPDRTARGES